MKRKYAFQCVLSVTVIFSVLYQIRFLLYIQYLSLPQISLVGLDINHCFINNTAYMEIFQFFQLKNVHWNTAYSTLEVPFTWQSVFWYGFFSLTKF